MKKIKTILVSILAVLSTVMVASCGGGIDLTTTEAYGVVHKDYIGHVKVDYHLKYYAAGDIAKLNKIEIDEVFLPHTWAKTLTVADGERVISVPTPSGTNPEATTNYARFIMIDNLLFEAEPWAPTLEVDGTTKQRVNYFNNSIPNLFKHLQESEENARWYYRAIELNKYRAASSDGGQSTIILSDKVDGKRNMFKSDGFYWVVKNDDGELIGGWQYNMNLITEEYIKTFNGEEWLLAGATVTDKADYVMLIEAAMDKVLLTASTN